MKFKKFTILIFALFWCFFINLKAECFSADLKNLDLIIKSSTATTVSVSVKDVETEKPIYAKNENLLLHPASTLKTFTVPVIMQELGKDAKITTSFYTKDCNLYIKLAGDPMFTTDELNKAIAELKLKNINQINDIIIDDKALDDNIWGIGWLWDNYANESMPKFSAYNLNHNLMTIKISTKDNGIAINSDFPIKIVNNLKISDKTCINVIKKPWIHPETIVLSGFIDKSAELKIPVAVPKEYFLYNLKNILKANEIRLNGDILSENLPNDAVLVETISNNLNSELKEMTHNSDNLVAESLLKIAAKDGTTKTGILKFNDFYEKLGVPAENLYIVDGCGASHNDLIYTDWMTSALDKLYKTPDFKEYFEMLATPGVGTLKHRLLDEKGNVHAKTGTISSVSGLTGYVKANSGKMYSFAILIQNFKGCAKKQKHIEDLIVQELIKKL